MIKLIALKSQFDIEYGFHLTGGPTDLIICPLECLHYWVGRIHSPTFNPQPNTQKKKKKTCMCRDTQAHDKSQGGIYTKREPLQRWYRHEPYTASRNPLKLVIGLTLTFVKKRKGTT